MRIFLKGKYREHFQNNGKTEKKNNKNNKNTFNKKLQSMNEESRRKLAQLKLDKSKYPLAIETILDIQGKYSTDLKSLTSQDLNTLDKYTPEQYPENVGLPKPVDKNALDYSKLIEENKVIKF